MLVRPVYLPASELEGRSLRHGVHSAAQAV